MDLYWQNLLVCFSFLIVSSSAAMFLSVGWFRVNIRRVAECFFVSTNDCNVVSLRKHAESCIQLSGCLVLPYEHGMHSALNFRGGVNALMLPCHSCGFEHALRSL